MTKPGDLFIDKYKFDPTKQLPPLSAEWRRIPLAQCPECHKLMPAHQERCNAHVEPDA